MEQNWMYYMNYVWEWFLLHIMSVEREPGSHANSVCKTVVVSSIKSTRSIDADILILYAFDGET